MALKLISDLNLALVCLRVARGWSQKQLALAAGVSANLLSDYERGRKRLHREKLERLVGKLGMGREAVEEALSFVGRIRRFEAPAPELGLHRRDEDQPATAVSGEVEREHRHAAVAQIRLLRGWQQKQLAAAAGVLPSSISHYERGKRAPSLGTLLRLADAAGLSAAELDRILGILRSRRSPAADVATPGAAAAPGGGAARSRAAGDSTMRAGQRLPAAGSPGAAGPPAAARQRPWIEVASSMAADRYHASRLWQRLEGRPAAEIREVIERETDLRHWAVCEVLADQSLRAAHDCATRSIELADLAVRVAELYPGQESSQLRLLGYAWAHVANGLRVRGDAIAATEVLDRGKRFWRSGPADPMLPLSESRLPSLEVSTVIDRWRLCQAIELADKALAVPTCDQVNTLLTSKALALMRLGEIRSALRIYARLPVAVGADTELTVCVARVGLVSGLYNLGLYRRAQSLLPVVRKSLLTLGRELFLIRFGWLEGRIAAAMGREEEALESLTQVQAAFLTRNMHCDAAMAGLELADLLLARGRPAEARELAGAAAEMARGLGMDALAKQAQDRLKKVKSPEQFDGRRRDVSLHLQEWTPARPTITGRADEPVAGTSLSDQERLTREFQRWAGAPAREPLDARENGDHEDAGRAPYPASR
jgi:transcriptional regulator with XRE-family HTH domain